jgi:hypothetical protein
MGSNFFSWFQAVILPISAFHMAGIIVFLKLALCLKMLYFVESSMGWEECAFHRSLMDYYLDVCKVIWSMAKFNSAVSLYLLMSGVLKFPQLAWAHPRTLTGSDGRLRKDKRQTCKKAGIRWAGHSGGDTQQPPPPPASLLYTAANKEVEQQFLGGMAL